MGRAILTRNIVLLLVCSESECDAKGELSIEELRDFEEPSCEKCTGFMMVSDDAVIKN
jgi:hypothetical protein